MGSADAKARLALGRLAQSARAPPRHGGGPGFDALSDHSLLQAAALAQHLALALGNVTDSSFAADLYADGNAGNERDDDDSNHSCIVSYLALVAQRIELRSTEPCVGGSSPSERAVRLPLVTIPGDRR